MTSTLALLLGLVGLGGLAAGILVGRYYVSDDRMLRRAARHARSYARAASLTLEGEQREAIDELKQVVAENVDDIEPYFALGALFRAQGDWERAIRIHQSIAARESGNKQVQVRALHALGLDFRRAGMPRRATRALESCLALDGKHESALRGVTALYEELGRYEDAAESLHRLQKLRNEEPSMRHHHLLVAAAQRAVYAGDLDRAKRLLRHGRRIDEHSVHYLTATAELAAARGDAAGAGASLREALRLAPELAGFLVPGLIEAERQLVMAGWDQGQGEQGERADAEAWGDDDVPGHMVGHMVGQTPGSALDRVARAQLEEAARRVVVALEEVAEARDPHLQLAMAELRSHYDPARALEDYRHIAEAFAGLLPARVAAARLALAGGDADEIRAELKALVAADGILAWATEGSWRCSACGHRQPDFFWRCASCRGWGTARLDVGRDALEPPLPPPWAPRPSVRGGVDAALRGAAERALPMPLGAGAAPGAPTLAPAPALAHAGEGWQPGAGARTGAAPTMLSRVGAWFSGVSRSLARRQREHTASMEPRAEPRALAPGEPRALAPGRDAGADNAVDDNEPRESNPS